MKCHFRIVPVDGCVLYDFVSEFKNDCFFDGMFYIGFFETSIYGLEIYGKKLHQITCFDVLKC